MEQQTHPWEENSPRLETQNSLLPETQQVQNLLEHPTNSIQEPVEVEALGAELSRLARLHQRRAGRAIWSVPLVYGLSTTILLLAPTMPGDRGAVLMTSLILLFWLGLTGFMVASIVKPRKKSREMAQALADLEDLRAIGPLIDTFHLEDRKIHEIAMEALTRLLPRLQGSDANLLKSEQHTLLCRSLNRLPYRSAKDRSASPQAAHPRVVSFRIAILQALAQVGDRTAIPVVEGLAQREAKTDPQRRIQTAARSCLPALLLRVEQERIAQTLLRPASASDAAGDSLLRAATGFQATEPQQLLRPGPPGS